MEIPAGIYVFKGKPRIAEEKCNCEHGNLFKRKIM
jgi:hypothetical protein